MWARQEVEGRLDRVRVAYTRGPRRKIREVWGFSQPDLCVPRT